MDFDAGVGVGADADFDSVTAAQPLDMARPLLWAWHVAF